MHVVDGFDTEFIPTIDDPAFGTDYFGDADDDLLVVETAEGARAYPVRLLDVHHLVNDTVDGTPVLVSFCPLCGTVVAYDRRVDGRTLTFEFGGTIVENNLVVRDTETGSEWKQSTGECLGGELAGAELEIHSARMTTLADFRESYPDGVVLQRPDVAASSGFEQFAGATTALLDDPAGREVMEAGFSLVRAANLARDPETGTERVDVGPFLKILEGAMELRSWVSGADDADAGVGYDGDVTSVFQREDTFGYLALHGGPTDWRENGPGDLGAKTRVLGVERDGEALGFPRPRVEAAGGVVRTTVGDTDVVVFAADGELAAFEDPGFAFEPVDDEPSDDEAAFAGDGARWDGGTGESDDGRELSRLSTSWTFAYAWQTDHGPDAFHAEPEPTPETESTASA
jgi:hypothetical protein